MQSFYQFYQKISQESFDNTNNLLLEIFDKVNLDGVSTTESHLGNYYTFEDTVDGEKHFYKVSIFSPPPSSFNINNFMPVKYNDLYSQFKTKYPDSWDVANIHLTIDGRYIASNLGNHNFVYSKMIACIQDSVSKLKPLFLKFTGAQDAMELVYDKFIRMSQRIYPQDAYVPYEIGYYIRKEVYDLIPNDDNLELAKKEREGYLMDIRKKKKETKDFYRSMQSPNNTFANSIF